DHGPYPGYASQRVFANTGIANNTLAFVRINKAPSRSSTCFFLYKLSGDWIIMDKLWIPVRKSVQTTPQSAEYANIETLLNDYFKALANADIDILNALLHKEWDLKYLDSSGKLNVTSKKQYIAQIQGKHEHIDFSQLWSIDLYHDKLAVVLIDIPLNNTTSFLVIFKINGQWKIAGERKTVSDNKNY
ncbi:MAG: nuclear transport factor 2 family protein, partial [Allomuricauda sp.]